MAYIKKITVPGSMTGTGTAASYDIKAVAVETSDDTTNALQLVGVVSTEK